MQFSRRDFLRSALWTPLAALALVTVPNVLLKSWSKLNYEGKVIYSGDTQKKVVALTFDDGPDPTYTPQILKLLAQYNILATFFVVGQQVEHYPEIVLEQHRLGHELANHTYSHPELVGMALPEVFEEIQRCQFAIFKMTGDSPIYFRPPKKIYNNEIIKLANKVGLLTVFWTVCIENHAVNTPETMANRVIAKARTGGIILGHDGRLNRQKTVDALPPIIEEYQKKGFEFVTLKQLLNAKN